MSAERIVIGHPPIDIQVRRRKNARRLTLRLGRDGATLTMPSRVKLSEAEAFAQKQESWLRRAMAKVPETMTVTHGAIVPFMGEPMQVVQGQGRGCKILDFTLAVGGSAEVAGARIQAWLKSQARERLAAASDHYAAEIGKSYGRLSLRDTKSRWGSCTADGNLMYSWRLIMAPPEILDYVAAHEVAHLQEMNHSPRFWSLVGKICPEWRDARDWLRQNGAELHRYRFVA